MVINARRRRHMKVGILCNREIIIAGPEAGVEEAARLMRRQHVGSVVVVAASDAGNKPIGIVTDRDLVLEVLAQDVDPASVSLRDIMTEDPLIVGEDDGVWDVLQQMRQHGVRRCPVVDREGVLVGLITIDDLVDLLAEELGELAKLIRHEQRQERARRTAA